MIGVLSCSLVAALLAPPSPEELERTIAGLGGMTFAERESAARHLAELGESARAALETAAAKGKDAEVRDRAARLLADLDRRSIVGEWECVAADGPRLVVGKEKISFEGSGAGLNLEYQLSSGSNPRALDLIRFRKDVVRGLYRLSGDELRLCLPKENLLKRPPEFAKEGDTAAATITFRRKKN